MCTTRGLTSEVFVAQFIAHPLLRHIGTRLVWGVLEKRVMESAFRVAEDGTFADVNDDAFILPKRASLVIVHPAMLDEEARSAWKKRFADYKILQPFEQLHRATYEGAMEGYELRFARDALVSRGHLFGLSKHGWRAKPEVARWPAGSARCRRARPSSLFRSHRASTSMASRHWGRRSRRCVCLDRWIRSARLIKQSCCARFIG